MMIVDSQVHIWAADSPDRPWPPGQAARAHRPVPLTAEGLLHEMDAAGVSRAVLVPPSWEGDRNDVVLAAAQRYPDRFAAMGRLSLKAPESRDTLLPLARTPGMLGFRFTFHTEAQQKLLTEGTAEWLWPAAEAAGVALMIHAPHSLSLVDAIATRHPALRLIIDHLGIARSARDHAAFAHLRELVALARRPNVAVKASALPDYSSEPYPFPILHDYIRQVHDAFGPRRMFWGSDMSRGSHSYRQIVTLFTEELTWLSEDDKTWIMGRALCEWLNWSSPSASPRRAKEGSGHGLA
ncbi:amidohydrolase family protein [Bradyrhizobium sp. LHD-71]|uniref:amidohydrolase family protein n=1 Tax=Bradyrhizobium sp. LHD-71 TaxID=3072141 RepID=UPI00280F9521|nr:amidohydrolase family protein [Bradyrhizobium sp. LHD-71]MDQ8729206.1 amidohydrolase family protein [Bradyrhizobium sp. LHD-71]